MLQLCGQVALRRSQANDPMYAARSTLKYETLHVAAGIYIVRTQRKYPPFNILK